MKFDTANIKFPSLKKCCNSVAKGLRSAADAVDNAKTPSLKEVRTTVCSAANATRDAIADTIHTATDKK